MARTFLTARVLILQAIASGGPAYGLAIADRVVSLSGVTLGPGRLYPELRALEAEGVLSVARVESSRAVRALRGGRPRVYYKLTTAGAREVAAQRKSAARVFGWSR
jgi:DNA-binding PadR family transcriptional regulator